MRKDDDAVRFLTRVLNSTAVQELHNSAQALRAGSSSGVSIFQCDAYHDASGKAVIIGDAAHTMSSALGQGTTCALADANALVDCLQVARWKDLPSALQQFSLQQVPEGHAITELNFARRAMSRPFFILLSQMFRTKLLRKKGFIADLLDPTVPYSARRWNENIAAGVVK